MTWPKVRVNSRKLYKYIITPFLQDVFVQQITIYNGFQPDREHYWGHIHCSAMNMPH